LVPSAEQTAQDLLHLLKHPTSKQSGLLSFGSAIHNAITEVATILDGTCQPPSSNKKYHSTPPRVPFETLPRVIHPQQYIPQLLRVNTHLYPVQQFYIPQPSYMLYYALINPKSAGKIFNPSTGHPETIDTLLAGADKNIWLKSLANEIGRCSTRLSKLCKPCDVIKGNNTVFFMKPRQVPPNRSDLLQIC